MAKSVLAAIHDAMRVDAETDSVGGSDAGAGIEAGEQKDKDMTKPTSSEAGAATVAQEEHDAAVSAAEETGRKAGAAEERGRLVAILGAENIKGDGRRMAAALDLAAKSPDMKAEDVTAFVTGNVPAAKAGQADAATYEQSRLDASGLASPSKPEGTAKGGLSGLVSAHLERSSKH